MRSIKLDGGLGNQMFQYAFIKSVSEKNNDTFRLDASTYSTSSERGKLEINKLNISEKVFSYSHSVFNNLQLLRVLRKLGVKKFGNCFIEKGVLYDSQAARGNYSYYYGYFQSFKYFDDIKKELQKELRYENAQRSGYLEKIEVLQSVGVHVRRGDYISNSNVFNLMHQLNKDYYVAAAEFLQKKTSTPLTFFLFSNDQEWVENELLDAISKFGECIVVNHDDEPDSALLDFECMKACKHHVIANSTFSWWAAYLKPESNGYVVAPAQWYKKGDWSKEDLYPGHWHIL